MEDFTLDQLYLEATEQEQKWFQHYLINKNGLAATFHAYKNQTEDSAKSYTRTVMGRARIKGLIEKYIVIAPPLPTMEDLRERYIAIADNPEASMREQLQALAAYERVSGFQKKIVKDADEFDPMMDIQG